MRFSSRLPASLAPGELQARLAAFGELVELTESNPTRCGFAYPPAIGAALAEVDAATYAPDPRGLALARAAVAAYAGGAVAAEQVLLTASSSEAYAFLFKLLCEPGDVVAVPAPSYPLLDVLARLEGIGVERYRLEYDGAWRLDPLSLRQAIARGARLIVAVEPNNPTGSSFDPADGALVAALCREHGLPLVVDQVFGPYRRRRSAWSWPVAELPLVARLDGLSKAAGLPQLKLGWMVLEGRAARDALARLEWIADAFLSVGAPVQHAAPALLAAAPALQQQINARVAANRAALVEALAPLSSVTVLASEGGWSAVLRLPRLVEDDALVLHLAERAGVLVHPGYFYDFAADGFLVVGLLLPEAVFAAAARRVADALAELLDDL